MIDEEFYKKCLKTIRYMKASKNVYDFIYMIEEDFKEYVYNFIYIIDEDFKEYL